MAVTRLSDAIVPEVFAPYMLKETMEKSNIFSSGAVTMDSKLADDLAGGGRLFQVPFWNDLDNTEAGIASDDPTVDATPGKLGSAKMQAVRQIKTRGWSSARLLRELAGDNPQQRIISRVSDYWARQMNTTLVKTMTGIIADNVANDSSDMVNDITGDATKTISAEAVLDTKQTLGDAADSLALIIMHSVIYTNLQKQNLIDFIPNARGEVNIPTYLNYRVVVSDTAYTVSAGGGNVNYHTYLLGEGAFGFAEVPVDVPVEVESKPASGNGMGTQFLWTRRQFILHPYGWNYTDLSTAGEFPTHAELATAGNWDRKYPERKQVPIAVLITQNG